jgi:hypothetical protein
VYQTHQRSWYAGIPEAWKKAIPHVIKLRNEHWHANAITGENNIETAIQLNTYCTSAMRKHRMIYVQWNVLCFKKYVENQVQFQNNLLDILAFKLRSQKEKYGPYILWHADLLQGNDSEISNYTTAYSK